MIVSELSTQVNDLLRPMGITRILSAYSILCLSLIHIYTKLDTSGFTNGISSMTVAAGNLIADFVKSASSKMAELVTSSVDIGASFETALAKVSRCV